MITEIQRVREIESELPNFKERVELAAAFRWTARLNMHEKQLVIILVWRSMRTGADF